MCCVYSVLHKLESDTGKPGVWGPGDSRGRTLALQSKHSIDAWLKWTLAVNIGLGAQNAGGGGGGGGETVVHRRVHGVFTVCGEQCTVCTVSV